MHRIQKTISEFITKHSVPAVEVGDSVAAAVAVMTSHVSDCALVLESGDLVGIFTERDFLYRVMAAGKRPGETRVAEVMTPEPVTLRPGDSVAYAINCMVTRGFRNIPIIDDRDRAIAVLDVRDVMGHINEVFAEIEDAETTAEVDEWTDIGGGD